MNYTQNYHLPQWVKEDRIMMEDFNAAMASMESGMTASTATANAAAAKADAAKQSADTAYTPANKPYAIGGYSGMSDPQSIVLGFRPSFLIITRYHGSAGSNPGPTLMITNETLMSDRVTFTDTGFTLARVADVAMYEPRVNEPGYTYIYIAFK